MSSADKIKMKKAQNSIYEKFWKLKKSKLVLVKSVIIRKTTKDIEIRENVYINLMSKDVLFVKNILLKELTKSEKSFWIKTIDGTKNSTINIPKPRPYTNVTIVGFKNCASFDVSKRSGIKPKTVVKVVSKTGLSLSHIASTIAGFKPLVFEYSSIVDTKTIESLIIIPVIPIKPIIENIDKLIPHK